MWQDDNRNHREGSSLSSPQERRSHEGFLIEADSILNLSSTNENFKCFLKDPLLVSLLAMAEELLHLI